MVNLTIIFYGLLKLWDCSIIHWRNMPQNKIGGLKMNKKAILLILVCVLVSGCSIPYTGRFVHESVYEGLDTISQDSQQAKDEAIARYNKNYERLVEYAPAMVDYKNRQEGVNIYNVEDTLAGLEMERVEFERAMTLNDRSSKMAEEIKKSLGWKEGPSGVLGSTALGLGAIGAGALLGSAL